MMIMTQMIVILIMIFKTLIMIMTRYLLQLGKIVFAFGTLVIWQQAGLDFPIKLLR